MKLTIIGAILIAVVVALGFLASGDTSPKPTTYNKPTDSKFKF